MELVGSWDESLPQAARNSLTCYHEELPIIGLVSVDWQVITEKVAYVIHASCDSSKNAYTALVYSVVRIVDDEVRRGGVKHSRRSTHSHLTCITLVHLS